MAAPGGGSSLLPSVMANTILKITRAPRTTAPVSTKFLETEHKTAVTKQQCVGHYLYTAGNKL
jgi:hypothetical protein